MTNLTINLAVKVTADLAINWAVNLTVKLANSSVKPAMVSARAIAGLLLA